MSFAVLSLCLCLNGNEPLLPSTSNILRSTGLVSRKGGTSLVGSTNGLEEVTVAADLSNDPHIRALREALVTEHEATVADAQHRADEAAARGDESGRRWYQEQADRLRAIPYPWERPAAAA